MLFDVLKWFDSLSFTLGTTKHKKKEGAMAKVTCAICNKETDSGNNGVKHCPKCGLWFCYNHAGPGRTQCPKCMSYSLK
jgi:Zn finger protein HypA/HybF involved in hydrogenase expression